MSLIIGLGIHIRSSEALRMNNEKDTLIENMIILSEKLKKHEAFLKGVTIGMSVLFVVLLIVLIRFII